MTLKSTVATLTQTAVSTAVTAVRHPIDTTTRATGLVKDTAEAGIGLVRGRIGRAASPSWSGSLTASRPARPTRGSPP